MATLDVFNTDIFSTISLSGMVDKVDYKPEFLGSLGIFTPNPVRDRTVWVDSRSGGLELIQTSADGSAPEEKALDSRTARSFKTQRLAKSKTIYASEIASWRAFGTESENSVVMTEYNRYMEKVRADIELTHELHRLGALQGILLDADGSTIFDYFSEFSETNVAAINFALSTATTNVRTKCHEVTRGMRRSAKGTGAFEVHSITGDDFFDLLIEHANVKDAYLSWSAAADLAQGKAFGSFRFGGITWHNYRGTDNNSDVAVGLKEAKFFPVGAANMFTHIQGPGEAIANVGAPGQNIYSMNIRDRDRDMWVKNEQYSYPLFMCQQPGVLRKATTP